MKIMPFGLACSAAALLVAIPATAAADFYLKIDNIKGEAAKVDVVSWSWGAKSSPLLAATSADRQDPQQGQAASRAGSGAAGRVATGDINGDGRADLARLAQHAQVNDFVLVLPADAAAKAGVCDDSSRLNGARLVQGSGEEWELANVQLAGCDRVSAPRQTQGATFGERMQLRLRGDLKNTKTGHVTLLR